MKWVIKASASAVLSRIPGGRTVYHKLQRALGSNRFNFEESLKRSAEIVDLIREAGGTLERAVCLEVGTGWRPFLPIILRLAGAKRILTFDVNPWLDRRYAEETITAIGRRLDEIAVRLELPEEEVRARFEQSYSDEMDPNQISVRDRLEQFHIQYRCPADARDTKLPEESVDYILSSNVLEHVPPEILGGIHRESRRILKPGGLIVHRFNPQDHYVAVDPSITGANFLRFSKRQWYWLGGSGLAYHNRLRCVEHRQLVEQAGFDVAIDRVRLDEQARQAIQSGELPIHSDFSAWTADELAADYMWLAACPVKEIPFAPRPSATMAASERIGSHELV